MIYRPLQARKCFYERGEGGGCRDMHGDAVQRQRVRCGLSPAPRPSGPRPAPPAWGPRKEAGAVETLWSERGAKVRRWPCLKGKDPSEAWKNGLHKLVNGEPVFDFAEGTGANIKSDRDLMTIH